MFSRIHFSQIGEGLSAIHLFSAFLRELWETEKERTVARPRWCETSI